ncbi:hypothetical protein [Allobranchiibius sp. CTAmp26]|uniref:hypothetical protein n=1 Tax=Allobranchiibius sp. CTAmp26 TaxID=2815214 RepID=UPI001AA167DB|nr:hypothetical protein [Allobranchiibius sp. CTAmp26]MBO1753559.1 hypothetical protein [Allobranchiibius sp. CTAmp26]
MSRRLTAIAAVPLIAAVGVAVAAPAGASPVRQANQRTWLRAAAHMQPTDAVAPSGSCNLVVPTTARIGKFETDIPVKATGDCASKDGLKALWYTGPDLNDSDDGITFEGSPSGTWYLYSFSSLGTRTWNGWVAIDGDNHVYTQSAPKTTVKVVSYAGLNTSRASGKTTLNTRVIRYATSLDENIPYVGETGVIQYRPVGGTTWTGLKNVVANSTGTYSYTYTTSQTREYRVVYKESATIWGSTSPTSTR